MIRPSLPQGRAGGRWWLAMFASLLALSAQAGDRYWPPIVDPPTGKHTPGRFVWGDLVTFRRRSGCRLLRQGVRLDVRGVRR